MSAHITPRDVRLHPQPPRRKRARKSVRPKGVWANCTPNLSIFYVSAADASREHGACRNSLPQWLRKNRLRAQCYIGENRRLMVPAKFVMRWREAADRRPELQRRTPKGERIAGKAVLAFLGCSETPLAKAVKDGRVNRYRSGSALYYLRPEVERLKLESFTRPPPWLLELPLVAKRLGRTRESLSSTIRRRQVKTTLGWSPVCKRHVSFIDVSDAEELLGEPWHATERADAA